MVSENPGKSMETSNNCWARPMYKIAAILFLVVFVASCRNANTPGSPFARGQLSSAEVASMQQKSMQPWPAGPVFRAVWEDGPRRHVCLTPGVLGGFNAYFNVAVFFPDGMLDEQTDINVPEGYEPYRLLQLFGPMVIWFRDPDGNRRDFFREATRPEEWQTGIRQAEDMLKEKLARLEATGTNSSIVAAFKARLKELQDARDRVGTQ